MGRIRYDPVQCAESHRLHYGSGIPVFRGEQRQVGYGLRSLIGNIVRGALPVLKPVAKHLARSALTTGRHILSDVLSGRDDLKSSARKRVAEAIGGSPREPASKRRKKKPRRIARKADILG